MKLANPSLSARRLATLRERSTISAIAGIRFATSRTAMTGGESNVPGWAPRLSSQTLNATVASSTIPTPHVA